MAYAKIYVQEDDPGAVGFGNEWIVPSTGLKYIRNNANTAWTIWGSAVRPDGGFIQTSDSGFVSTGAITGNTGWAPIDSPDFSTSLKIAGVNAATVNDVEAAKKSINENVEAIVSQLISHFITASIPSGNLTMSQKTLTQVAYNTPLIIPMPVYSGSDTTADPSNSKITIMYTSFFGNGYTKFRDTLDTVDVDPSIPGTTFISYYIQAYSDINGIHYAKTPAPVRYLVIARR